MLRAKGQSVSEERYVSRDPGCPVGILAQEWLEINTSWDPIRIFVSFGVPKAIKVFPVSRLNRLEKRVNRVHDPKLDLNSRYRI